MSAAACSSGLLARSRGEEREIRRGEVHPYPVELAAGEVLRAVVEEQGIDLSVHLLGPDGAELAHADGFHHRGYPEEMVVLAPSAGAHTLQVRVVGEKKPAGRYRLAIEPPRRASDADRLRAEALRITQEANDAYREPWERQRELREAALARWRSLDDRGRLAEALFQLGLVHGELESAEQAAELHHEAARIWEREGDRAFQAEALRCAGVAERGFRPEQARADLERASELAVAAGDLRAQADALNSLGRLEVETDQAPAAIETYRKALGLAVQSGSTRLQASILNNLAGAYDRMGEPQRALELYQQVLKIPEVKDRASTYNNPGALYQGLGEWELAAEHYRKALELKKISPAERARTLNNLGAVLAAGDEPGTALPYLEEALALGGDDQEVQVRAARSLALVRVDLGEPAAARELASRALAAATGRTDLAIEARTGLGAVLLAAGDLAGARTELERARDLARQRKDLAWQANADLLLARVERAEGAHERALDRIREAIASVESLRSRVLSPTLRATLLASRHSYYELQIDLLMDLAGHPGGDRYLAEALAASEQARARSFLDLLTLTEAGIFKGADPQLFARRTELSQQVGLRENRRLELLRDGAPDEDIAAADARVEEALAEYDLAEQELLGSNPHYRSLARPDLVGLGEIQRELLGPDCLLLEYALGRERSYLWAVTQGSVEAFGLPPRREVERLARALYDRLLERGQPSPPPGEDPEQWRRRVDAQIDAAAEELGQAVLGPAAHLLAGRRLLVVPDGALHYVPFAALEIAPWPGAAPEALVVRHEVVVLPSASALAALREETQDRQPPPGILAMVADPLYERDDERLAGKKGPAPAATTRKPPGGGLRGPTRGSRQGTSEIPALHRLVFSGEEADGIEALVPDPDRKLVVRGHDASGALALSGALGRYRYVHFATHGYIDTRRPQLSALVLAQFDQHGNPREDGFLRLAHVYDLELNADLVVLSACETALGREIRGEGLVGLTRGFMHAGAARVVASLWNVNDRATALLMESFYEGMLKPQPGHSPSPSAALRRAQLELRANPRWASPYYWAGFSLQGEWK